MLTTHPAANCAFLFLQVVLAPLLYPYGYVVQIALVGLMALLQHGSSEQSRQLLDPLLLVLVLTNLIMGEDIPVAGYASRAIAALLLCYLSAPLNVLGVHLVDPRVACFLVLESLAAPHLYPVGYAAQLALFLFVAANLPSTSTGKTKYLDDGGALSSSPYTEDSYTCKICLDRRVDLVFANCGHCCCQRCSDQLTKKVVRQACPFCNAEITQRVALYFP